MEIPENAFKKTEEHLVLFHNVAQMLDKNILVIAKIQGQLKNLYYKLENRADLTQFMQALNEEDKNNRCFLSWYCLPSDNKDILKQIEFID